MNPLPTTDRPTDYDAFVPLYERCYREIHKASREDAFEAALEMFYLNHRVTLSMKFDAFMKRYYAGNPARLSMAGRGAGARR